MRPNLHAITFAMILSVALYIRLATANYSLWYDEVAALTFARQPLSRLWSAWMIRETNPPLYYSLLRIWTLVFGDGDRTARTLSVLIGLTGVATLTWAGRAAGKTSAGLFAASLYAVSAAQIDASHEIRSFVLAYAAALLATGGMIQYLKDRTRRALVIYAIGASAALYSHTTAIVFIVIANVMMLFLLYPNSRALRGWLGTNVCVAMIWAWWAMISVEQSRLPHPNFGWIDRPTLSSAIQVFEQAYLPAYMLSGGVLGAIELACLAGALVGLLIRDRDPTVRLLAGLCLFSPLTISIISLHIPALIPRVAILTAGPLLLLIALLVFRLPLRPRSVVMAVLVSVFTAGLIGWLPYRETERWPEALRAIEARAPGEEVIVASDAMAVVASHFRDRIAPDVKISVLQTLYNPFDRWADGLYRGPHLTPAGALALLKRRGNMVTLERGDIDPAQPILPFVNRSPLPNIIPGRQPFASVLTPRGQSNIVIDVPTQPGSR